MKRTGFRPCTPSREQRDPDRVRSVPTVSDGAWRAPRAVDAMPAAQVRKAAPVRSERYRRAVRLGQNWSHITGRAKTRRQLNELGLWPAGIPKYPTDEAA